MAPSDEALTWQRRADDWAQQAEVEPYKGGGGQAIEPVNRWSSEVTTTGRPTFPADGVGWRTETAEWRATGARWRQTTEWRSATGSHVWRSTTEAWRSEDDAAPEREKPSIPGTAWETGSTSDATAPSWRRSAPETPSWRQTEPETPTWRQSTPELPGRRQSEPETPTWRTDPDTSSSWQRRTDLPAATTPVEQTPSWRQPSTQTPSWRQASTQTPSWQQPSTSIPSWQQPQQTPSWQQSSTPSRARGTDTGSWSTSPDWSDRPGPDAGRSDPGENTTGMTRWDRTDTPGWQRSPAEDARHLVREDDRAAWSRDAGHTGGAGYTDRPTRAGRRRAAENQAAPSGGSGWSSGADDDWAGHTDTGSIPVFNDRDDAAEAMPWSARSEAPSRRDRRRQASDSRPETSRAEPGGRRGNTAGRQPRYNANASDWREDTASWDAEQDTSNWTRDPDTGQWSRAEDDPRVLAWRAEAARREAMRKSEPENTGRRARRADPSGGVPGGPLPSSSIPASDTSTSGWAPGSPMDDGPTRRRRPDSPPRSDGFGGGRRRAADAAPPEQPLDSGAWQVAPEPRQTRQSRRAGSDPDGRSPGPMPPRWPESDEPEPRRRAYPDEGPRWQEPGYGGGQRELPPGGGYGQPRPDPPPRSGFGSAARELPAGPSAQPPRPAYGARELPAGPSAQPDYNGGELPAAPASGPSWREPQRPAYGGPPPGQSWLEQERQQRQAPSQRPAYGGPAEGEATWTDRERRRLSGDEGPLYSGQPQPSRPGYDDMPSEPRRPGYGAARALPAGGSAPTSGPAWATQQKPVYGSSPVSSPGDPSARWTDPLTDTSSRRGGTDRDDPPPPAGGGFGGRPPLADWLAAERAGRRGTGSDYRGAGQDGETDWRRELSRQSDLAEGESRRYDTSDFPPFRPSGSAAVDGSSNLALSATSVIQAPSSAGGAGAEEDTSWPPRRSTGAFQGTGAYERRPMVGDFPSGRQSDLLDPDDEEQEEQEGSPLAAVGYTVVWYGVPVVLFVAGIFLLNSGQRNHALETLADAAPEFGISLALSMLVAYGLRSATTAWKSASVGLAAAVVGGGLATVLSSAITGNSLS